MIDALLELQKPIMLFFQSISTPALDFIAKAVTYCGDAPVAILLLLIIYWCVDKRMGFAFDESTITYDDKTGKPKFVYFKDEICGFAIHLLKA